MNESAVAVRYGAFTAVGHVRDHNEDAWLADEALGLWIVADGMGGHEAGEVASRLACDAIRQAVSEGKDLTEAIHSAQVELHAAIERGKGSEGMGTTVVALKTDGSRYRIAWVGDSRAYLWHDGQLRRLTHDHSFVQELIDNQAISTEEAEQHPERSTLSRCLGGGLDDALEVDEINARFFAGERIILCSDGVSSEISDSDFLACLRDHSEAESQIIAEALVQRALDAGGNDNATALVIASPSDAPDRIRQTAPRRRVDIPPEKVKKTKRAGAVILVVAALVLALLATVAWFYFQRDDANPLPQSPAQSQAETVFSQKLVFRNSSKSHSARGGLT